MQVPGLTLQYYIPTGPIGYTRALGWLMTQIRVPGPRRVVLESRIPLSSKYLLTLKRTLTDCVAPLWLPQVMYWSLQITHSSRLSSWLTSVYVCSEPLDSETGSIRASQTCTARQPSMYSGMC